MTRSYKYNTKHLCGNFVQNMFFFKDVFSFIIRFSTQVFVIFTIKLTWLLGLVRLPGPESLKSKNVFVGYLVSGKSGGYPVSGHTAGLSGRIFSYFERKLKIYYFHEFFFCPFTFYLKKTGARINKKMDKSIYWHIFLVDIFVESFFCKNHRYPAGYPVSGHHRISESGYSFSGLSGIQYLAKNPYPAQP